MKRWFFLLLTAVVLTAVFLSPGAAPAAGILSPEEKYVALTFDDGPRRDTTVPLLEGLRQRGIPATFFLIGQQIPGSEDILLQMAEDGHQIGNHTYSHLCLQNAAEDTIIQEIQKTQVLLEELLGAGDYWLRPPYGLVDSRCAHLAATPMVYWSLDPEDWKHLDAQRVTDYVLANVEPGDIILLHDFYPTSVQAALQIADALLEQGYTFLTVEQLLERGGIQPQAGVLYASADGERVW